MKTVYYSSFSPPEFFGDHYMLFEEPEPLLQSIAKTRNKQNKFENYIDCPGFQNSIKNTFIIRNPINMSILINDNGIFPTNNKSIELVPFWIKKDNSRHLGVVNYHLNYIFFSEELEISTFPAYLHNTDFQSKLTYIPGSFNIGKWFRPIEGAFELKENTTEVSIKESDPLYYIKFHTNEKIKFVRFEMSSKLYQMTLGCMNYKKINHNCPLNYLYKLFYKTQANRLISKEIQRCKI